MAGQPPRFPHGGGRGPNYPHPQNPNLYLPNPNFYPQNPTPMATNHFVQNPNLLFPNPNFPIQVPNFLPQQQFPNQSFQPQPPPPGGETLERIERAIAKARRDLLTSRESVSAWKLTQSALLNLQAESWDKLGVQMQQVPSLHRLLITEGKVTQLQFARHRYLWSSHVGSACCRRCLSLSHVDRRMHLSHIRQAKRSENSALKILDELRQKSDKRSKKRPLFTPQKKQLDDHFRSISQRVKSFSSLHGDFGGKHIKFGSSCSEHEDSDDYELVGNKNDVDAKIECKLLSGNNNSCDRVSSCPYPSAAEEISRLGLKGELDVNASVASGGGSYNESNGLSKKRRKSENLSSNIVAPRKLPKKDTIGPDLLTEDERKEFIALSEADLLLPKSSMRMFVTTWKEACLENNVAEVLERMFQFYKTPARERMKRRAMFAELRQRKKMISMFSSYPCIGLLNVAIASIKSGMWDSMYDTFQAFTEHGVASPLPEKCPEYENIEVEPAERDALILAEDASTCKQSFSVEDIVHKVSTFFELDYNILSNINSSLEKKFTLMRKLRECEFWMTEQFSIKEFEALGYGDFFTFLEKHVSLLPNALQKCLTGYTYAKSPLEVCMLQHQLAVLLSQASKNLVGNEKLTKKRLSILLTRQFPPVSFILGESSSLKDFMDNVRTNESTSTCVLFSITLLGSRMGDANNEKTLSKTTVEGMEIFHKTGTLGSVTVKGAIEVLLRAPMLADLESWTHWDAIYAPTFGPLVGWLLNEVNAKELLCLVTKDGKVIRIDHTATVDSFLEAFLQGSSFQSAVKLLSLLSLYGGDRHVPLSLLKSYARQAFEVFMKNFSVVEVNENQSFLLQGNSLFRQHMSDVDAPGENSDLCERKSTVHEAVTAAVKFFIDCLCHFPVEFRPFAADILLSGLRSVIKDASSVILGKCKQIEQRLMLHDIGLSLGIVEWIDDYHVFGSTMPMDSFAFSGLACLQAVNSDVRRGLTCVQDAVNKSISSKGEMPVSVEVDLQNKQGDIVHYVLNNGAISSDYFRDDCKRHLSEVDKEKEAALVIESIRREEFGLDSRLSDTESSMLKKQHARLGRALQCLSQELYSQDSHFCALPCFRENPGKAVTAFMSFVPLAGEVHGFFSNLPRLIVSKLRISKCLLMEGDNKEWVLPCKVIRCWNEQARSLFPDSLLHEHLGLGFLDKDIVLSDSLARDLGIEEYGPKILLQIMSSLCHSENGIKSVGLVWLSSWINALYTMVFNSSGQISADSASDVINNLKRIPFIPLSDGTYSSVDDGTIWLHADAFNTRFDDYGPEVFPVLYAQLRTVSPALLSAAATVDISCLDVSIKANLIRVLQRVGCQQVSAHEIVMVHILPAISNDKITIGEEILMIEYLSFVMLHLQSNCPNCNVERGQIISALCGKAFILTNYGFKRPTEVSIHFSTEFGNPIDTSKFIDGLDMKWHEVDVAYLRHPITGSLPGGMMKWREFFQELGITDFVHIVSVEKSTTDIAHVVLKNMLGDGELISPGAVAKDWESPELVQLLSQLSLSGDRIKCKCLLEILDTLWDTCFTDKVTGRWISNSPEGSQIFKSSFRSSLCDVRWMVSIMDNELHYAKDLYYDCDAVRSILGATAPYVVPKVKSEKLLFDIGFKTQVSLNDALVVLQVWRRSETPFMASIAQMSRFYTFIWNEMATSKQKIVEELLSGPFIFVPYSCGSRHEDIVPGVFLSSSEVYWRDLNVSVNQIKEMHPHNGSNMIDRPLCKTLSNVYPSLHDFFVSECGVSEIPRLRSYLHILLQLSTVALASQAANMVFQVFLQWSDGLKSGILSPEDIAYLKECLLKLEFAVLPTVLDKWVSLHPSFGLICWCDDEKLRKEFKHVDDVDFLYFGELNDDEQEILRVKVSVLMQNLGIPALSEVIIREAIYYGVADSKFKASLLNWALPYAQRYIYKVHCDRYLQLKQSGFENLSHLQIIVVEKLFYRNILKKLGIASKKRFECSCLLLGNVLYATRESDSHALFMELSRLLFDGTPDLHLANFLHMITTMVESGSNEEQTEFFILNSQKVPKLPEEESVWSLSVSAENDETILTSSASPIINEQNPIKSKRKPGITSSWPPVDWKTAPAFPFPRGSTSRARTAVSPPSSIPQVTEGDSNGRIIQTDHVITAESTADWTIDGDPAATATIKLPKSEDSDHPVAPTVDDPHDSVDLVIRSDDPNFRSSKYNEREQLSFGTPNALQAQVTGRLGEVLAFNYFSTNAGTMDVKWVNQDSESGLPFDLLVMENGKINEYIEVKATRSGRKDWFTITVREWQFAVEKGEAFSIAHVHLLGNKIARVTVFKNPVRLCQLGKLQLSVLMPKQQQEFSTVS
ncbi:Striatin like [Actinidia chinensis var. chinensis]|uniref:Striatin like n=1 Tax=Actinidia chinensis var. chinensis TaxID=1590841 RepID=A0A2R6S097_ACTCC|nr:Striatin like [Actinidia chinensis var. chinensis]